MKLDATILLVVSKQFHACLELNSCAQNMKGFFNSGITLALVVTALLYQDNVTVFKFNNIVTADSTVYLSITEKIMQVSIVK